MPRRKAPIIAAPIEPVGKSKTIQEFMKDHSLSRTTIWRLLRSKALPCSRIGRCVRITQKQEAEFFAANSNG